MTAAGPRDDDDANSARGYAERLLAEFRHAANFDRWTPDPPAVSWARAGLAAVTGEASGAPLAAPVALSAAADAALAALAAIADSRELDEMRGAALLGARARLMGLRRGGSIAPGGACRLLAAADGMLAVNLPRQSDWQLAPAWLESPNLGSWQEIAAALAAKTADASVERARLLGLAVARADNPARAPAHWFETICTGPTKTRAADGRPLVIDLSSLWAGPLCADLLGRLGARVMKVESIQRPDGARLGNAAFYAQINGGKASISLDFSKRDHLAMLVRLIRSADIVIESARARALPQLGVSAEALVRETPGLTWIAISGYGRAGPEAEWIGFGDDCGVAAGLSRLLHEVSGQWLFCGDAIADPLTGIHAALLAWASWRAGGGALHAIALRDVAAFVAAYDRCESAARRRGRWLSWNEAIASSVGADYTLPTPRGRAQLLGASNHLLGAL